MSMKNALIVAVLVILAGGTYWYASTKPQGEAQEIGSDTSLAQDDMRLSADDVEGDLSSDMLEAETFSGKLEEVNEGCYVDGECYATVDGKHITLIMGWSQQTVGKVLGKGSAESSVGNLKAHIGKQVEVFAMKKSNGDYTLYGDESFYIKQK